MSSGGGGNDEVIEFQKSEAKDAERREEERQARLQYGRDRIMKQFSEEGGTYETPKTWGDITKTREVPVYGPASTTGGPAGGVPYAGSEGYGSGSYARQQQGSGGLYDLQEGQNSQGQATGAGARGPITGYTTEEYKKKGWVPGETQHVDGIGSDFYDAFQTSIMDYYTPEVQDQFKEAQEANLYDLARRGMLRSSVAVDHAGELAKERLDADARVAADAESQTAGLRGQMAGAQQNALSLLQQTEDPSIAADAAATEVNAIQSQAPQFNPLGDLFSAAARSFAGYQQQANQRKAYQQALAGTSPHGSAGRNVV